MRHVGQAACTDLVLAHRDHVVDGVAEEGAGGDVALPHVLDPDGAFGGQLHRLRPDGDDDLGADGHVRSGLQYQAPVPGFDDVEVPFAGGHGAVDEVRGADELGDELAPRILVDVAGLAQLNDLASTHHRDV